MVTNLDKAGAGPFSGVAVLDTNTCIDLKRRVGILYQWRFFLEMTELVRRGLLVFPWEVRQELVKVKHPDVPGAWAGYAFNVIPADLAYIEERYTGSVRERYYPHAGQAVGDLDNADPYVVGLALTLRSKGVRSVVVTEDGVVKTACTEHGVEVIDTFELVDRVQSAINPEQSSLFE